MASVLTKHSFKDNRELAQDIRSALAKKEKLDEQMMEEVINRLEQRSKDNHDRALR